MRRRRGSRSLGRCWHWCWRWFRASCGRSGARAGGRRASRRPLACLCATVARCRRCMLCRWRYRRRCLWLGCGLACCGGGRMRHRWWAWPFLSLPWVASLGRVSLLDVAAAGGAAAHGALDGGEWRAALGGATAHFALVGGGWRAALGGAAAHFALAGGGWRAALATGPSHAPADSTCLKAATQPMAQAPYAPATA